MPERLREQEFTRRCSIHPAKLRYMCTTGTLEEGLQYNIVTVLIKKIRKKARNILVALATREKKNFIVYV